MILPWGLSILPTASGIITRGGGPPTRGLVGVCCGPALGWLPGALGTLGAFLWLLGWLAVGLMPSLTGGAPPGAGLGSLGSCRMGAACCRGARRARWPIAGVGGTRAGLLTWCLRGGLLVALHPWLLLPGLLAAAVLPTPVLAGGLAALLLPGVSLSGGEVIAGSGLPGIGLGRLLPTPCRGGGPDRSLLWRCAPCGLPLWWVLAL